MCGPAGSAGPGSGGPRPCGRQRPRPLFAVHRHALGGAGGGGCGRGRSGMDGEHGASLPAVPGPPSLASQALHPSTSRRLLGRFSRFTPDRPLCASVCRFLAASRERIPRRLTPDSESCPQKCTEAAAAVQIAARLSHFQPGFRRPSHAVQTRRNFSHSSRSQLRPAT